MAANAERQDPGAYCDAIMNAEAEAEKADAQKRFIVAKTDDAQQLVFGYASVSLKSDGDLLEDLQGDIIEPADLEKAAYDYVLHARGVDEMHDATVKGQLVESFFLSDEKLQAMGLANQHGPRAAWWAGWKLAPDAYAKVKDGTYRMLSVELRGRREVL